jgi:hypothetical protein
MYGICTGGALGSGTKLMLFVKSVFSIRTLVNIREVTVVVDGLVEAHCWMGALLMRWCTGLRSFFNLKPYHDHSFGPYCVCKSMVDGLLGLM